MPPLPTPTRHGSVMKRTPTRDGSEKRTPPRDGSATKRTYTRDDSEKRTPIRDGSAIKRTPTRHGWALKRPLQAEVVASRGGKLLRSWSICLVIFVCAERCWQETDRRVGGPLGCRARRAARRLPASLCEQTAINWETLSNLNLNQPSVALRASPHYSHLSRSQMQLHFCMPHWAFVCGMSGWVLLPRHTTHA